MPCVESETMKVVEVRIPFVARIVVGEIPDAPDTACIPPATADALKIQRKMAIAGEMASRGDAAWNTRAKGASCRNAANICGLSTFIQDGCGKSWVMGQLHPQPPPPTPRPPLAASRLNHMCSANPRPAGSRSPRMVESERVLRCHGSTFLQPAVTTKAPSSQKPRRCLEKRFIDNEPRKIMAAANGFRTSLGTFRLASFYLL